MKHALVILMLVWLCGCWREEATAPAERIAQARVASLVPAATDILLSMQLQGRLVAVSNYEPENDLTDGLPRVGDYQTIDWERLAEARPTHLITFVAEDRLPAGVRQRAAELGAKVVNVRTDTLEEIRAAILTLGEMAGDGELARQAAEKFDADLKTLMPDATGTAAGRGKVSRGKVRVLLAMNEKVTFVVGRGGFLDQLLNLMGYENAAKELDQAYASIDAERLAQINPDVVVILQPGITLDRKTEMERTWAKTRQNQGAAARVRVLNGPRLLISGACVITTAREIKEAIELR